MTNTTEKRIKKAEYDKIYRKKMAEPISEYKSEWHRKDKAKNKEKYRKRKQKDKFRLNKNNKKRRKEDPSYAITCNLRSGLHRFLSGKRKSGSAIKDLGCSIEELKAHLESLFYPHPTTGELMSWENKGLHGWHIDHKLPLCSFDLTDRDQFLKACHYSNLQPLWAIDNLKKGAKLS